MLRRVVTVLMAIMLGLGSVVVPVFAQDGTRWSTHTVQRGETLYRIALRYNLSVQVLMEANGLSDPNMIFVGQVLRIPQSDAGQVPLEPPTEEDLGLLGVEAPLVTVPIAPSTEVVNGFSQPDLGLLDTGAPHMPTPESAADAMSPPAVFSTPIPSPASVALPSDALLDHADDLGILAPDTAAWLNMGIVSTGGPNVRKIYVQGLAQGNNPHAFSKIGDCNSEPPFFLAKFDTGEYDLGAYTDLQGVIEHFAGSFGRESIAAWSGNHVWAVLDPTWANPNFCYAGETPLACEFRLNRPSVVLIRLGTNEVGSPQLFEANLRQVIEFSIAHGTIPVLGTKADRLEGSDAMNEIIRALAAEYAIPLWDFGKVAERIPSRGLMPDGIHLSYAPPYYSDPATLQTGHGLQNLTALMALDAVWQAAMY